MTKEERISIVRVFVDLIKADAIIDEGEMLSFADIKKKYNISHDDEASAEQITFADAVSILTRLDERVRNQIFSDYKSLSVSDGFCARQEALLIMALYCCLQWERSSFSEMLSFPAKEKIVADNQLLYIESQNDMGVNEQIESQYRTLIKELNINSIDLVYIPRIVRHYVETSPELLKKVFMFLMPSLSEMRVESVIEKVLSVDTAVFVKDILCDKYGLKQLRQVPPSFLLKVGNDFVGGIEYSNFIRIEIADCDVLKLVRELMDYLSELQSSDVTVINLNNDTGGKFLYRGFFKQLIDLYTQKRSLLSRIAINPFKETIRFVDVDVVMKGLHRKEKALYTLFLLESANGGINFTAPQSASELEIYSKRMAILQDKYSSIYELFGGDRMAAPQLDQADIRRPMLSCIKKSVLQMSDFLHNVDDYLIERDASGVYNVHLAQELILSEDLNRQPESIFKSAIFGAYHQINDRVATL